ncbi:SDR family oxidoreductase [Thalassobaculum sp. OXR-137]|uniref:SDR family oxidoreductase n=1 Tax=Thalassobaculum sp. OXR-137 TaxID=3100173 RepID=UPI002AC93BF8|nr:SDR family oxidoreductase [Thalassobaculum sp. OXR-137]WPZ36673.1 SDR family oxidoreductase [Thalassobaculum sp. OXR-137]
MPQRTPNPLPKTALVTGAARRVGRAIALALAGAGWDVAVHYGRSEEAARDTAEDLRALGVRAEAVGADLADEAEVHSLIERTEAVLGPVGLLVNNASTFERDTLATATRQSWDRHIEPNLRAPLVLMQQFAARLPAENDGVVVNIIDQRVWNLTDDFLSYTLSKVGLWGLTRTLALELAPRIRVNGVGPGPILPSTHQDQERFDAQARSMPLQHGADPAEVAEAVLFLANARSVTGQMIAVDGGQHLWWAPPGPDTPRD